MKLAESLCSSGAASLKNFEIIKQKVRERPAIVMQHANFLLTSLMHAPRLTSDHSHFKYVIAIVCVFLTPLLSLLHVSPIFHRPLN